MSFDGNSIFLKQQSQFSKDELMQQIENFAYKPVISVIMPTYNAPIQYFKMAINSVLQQLYKNWQLCIVDDGSVDRRSVNYIKELAKSDDRIIVLENESNCGISYTSNRALDSASGDYVALMDQDDEITPDALFWFVKRINDCPEVEWLYSDECKVGVNSTEQKTGFYFKPDWSPALLINHMYTGHLSAYKNDIIKVVGGFRSEFDFSQDYDLALRVSNVATHVEHIERVLYFWRMLPTSGSAGGKDYARQSNLMALESWFKGLGINGYAVKERLANDYISFKTECPKVSIIIPSDSFEMLNMAIGKIMTMSSYSNYEIIPVTNALVKKQIEDEYSYALSIIRVCQYDGEYNFSKKCNIGSDHATGKYLVFFNDDVIPYSSDWIEKLINAMARDSVGGVSPMLLGKDMIIQYAGMISGVPGLIGTSFNGNDVHQVETPEYHHFLIRDVSVLSGACMMMEREFFFNLGGFDADNTPNGHSDVDLSFKILEAGKECVYTPYACLIHLGNHSWREPDKKDKSDIYCMKKWRQYIFNDRFFTDSMKDYLYNCSSYRFKMHKSESANISATKDILVILHQLDRSGAPMVVLTWIDLLISNGYYVTVISGADGPLRQDVLDAGADLIVTENSFFDHYLFKQFAYNFDLVISATMRTSKAVLKLSGIPTNVVWWIHEAACIYGDYSRDIKDLLKDNIYVYTGGVYAQKQLKRFLDVDSTVLNYGVSDKSSKCNSCHQDETFLFVIAGTIENRKGQDVLVDAIYKLAPDILEKTRYIFVGRKQSDEISNKIVELMLDREGIVDLRDNMPLDDLFDLYSQMDCLIMPSRDDPMPATVTEAMMMSKPCICSDSCGSAAYIEDGKAGYIFESEDSDQLCEIITSVVRAGKEKLVTIGKASRVIYETYFSMDVFRENANKIVEELLG